MFPDPAHPLRLTREQVRRVDRLATSKYHLSGLVLMENAARGAATIIHQEFVGAGRATVVCGAGNNGGDGLAIARHLHNFGWTVRVLLAGPTDKLTPDAEANFAVVQAMDLPRLVTTDPQAAAAYLQAGGAGEVIVDALLGTGFTGEVRPPTDALICAINAARPRIVVAVDVPSGLDADTGRPSSATVRADLTVTFVAEKVGFAAPGARLFLGRVRITDIGVPRELIDEVRRGDRPDTGAG